MNLVSGDSSERIGGESVKPALLRRLEFIDFRLLWSGRINRKDLSDTFQISSQQASADLATYTEHAPNNLSYDAALKTYLRTESFQPVYVGGNTDRYLLQLVAVRSGYMRKQDTWFETFPPLDVVSLRRRHIDPWNLQRVLRAIRECLELEVEYSSINSASTKSRWIAPHALGYCAGRWHARAWSRDHNDFRDFNLNRIGKVTGEKKASVDFNLDYEWHHFTDLVLIANPGLEPETRRAVEEEFELTNGRLVQPTRLSMIFYLMNEHNLDVEPNKLDPRKQQLTLSNRGEVENARQIARKMSAEALKRRSSE